MDIDPVSVPSQMARTHSNLKRSTSAPMINDLASPAASSATGRSSALSARLCTSPLSHVRVCDGGLRTNPRLRRFSATYVSTPAVPPVSPGGSGLRTPSRLLQIRQEENVEELAIRHERNIHTALQMSQSCEDLVLETEHSLSGEMAVSSGGKRCLTDPLHLNIQQQQGSVSPSVFSPRISPTRALSSGAVTAPIRLGCLSPLPLSARFSQQPFSPPASPSPTRRASLAGRRSMSPITLRPSPLGGAVSKRKLADGDCVVESGRLTPKRFHSGGAHCVSPGAHMLLSAVTTGVGSPAAMDQSSVHMNTADTPDSMSSAGSPCVVYKADSPPASRPHVQHASCLSSAGGDQQADISSHVFRPVHDVTMETGSSQQAPQAVGLRQLSEQSASSAPMAVDVLRPLNFPM